MLPLRRVQLTSESAASVKPHRSVSKSQLSGMSVEKQASQGIAAVIPKRCGGITLVTKLIQEAELNSIQIER